MNKLQHYIKMTKSNPLWLAQLAHSKATSRSNMIRTQQFLLNQGLLQYCPITDTYVCNVLGSIMHLHKDDTGISLDLARNGIREAIPSLVLLREIKPDMVYYDLGANIGYYALLAAVIISKGKGKVIAIEPEPNNFRILQLNIQANNYDSYVKAHQCAISNRTGTANMVVTSKSNAHYLTNNSSSNHNTIEVPCFSLPDFIEQQEDKAIDFLRMDIEGSEYLILPTIYKLMETGINAMFIEFHPDQHIREHIDIIRNLADLGYKTQDIIKFYFLHGKPDYIYCPATTIEDLWRSKFLLSSGAIHVILKKG